MLTVYSMTFLEPCCGLGWDRVRVVTLAASTYFDFLIDARCRNEN